MKRRPVSVAAACALVLSAAASAQQAPDTLEEIIVTAQKREVSIQDVPFSVGAVTSADMSSRGVTDLVELSRNVTGLTIADLGPGQSQVAIRGVSAGQVIRDQPGVKPQVGVYLDESPISVALFTPDLDLYDLERFEVLRGPQGTLFGSGSIAGTLRYITTQPKIGVTEGSLEVGASALTDGNEGGSVKGAVNAPLGDTAALRIAAYYSQLPGFIDGYGPGGSIKKDVNDGEKYGARVALLFKPNDDLSITPRVVYQKLATNGYPRVDIYNILGNPYTTTQPAVDVGKRGQYIQLQEGLNDDFKLGDLKIEYAFGGATLTSISSYTDRKVVVLRDASQLTGSVTWDLGGTDAEVRLNSPLYDTTKLKAFSQELRLASNGDGALQWLAGLYYEDQDKNYGQNLPTPGYDAVTLRLTGLTSADLGAPVDTPFYSQLKYKFRQFAAFGEATYRFTDQWSVTGGARYFDFNEDRTLYFAGLFSDYTPTPVPGEAKSDGIAPRLILSYDASADVKFNAQISRGFRLGGINDPINIPLCSAEDVVTFGNQKTWDDEWAWNYEIGAKMRLADGRVTLNIAAFKTDLTDLQVTTDAGSCSSRIVFNVPKAESYGLEAELFARPNANWDFGVSATWVKAELKSTVTSVADDGTTTVVGGLVSGARLPTAPEFQAVASAGYNLPLASGRDFFANLTWQFAGDAYGQIADQQASFGTLGPAGFIAYGNPTISSFTFDPKLPSYQIGNLRFGLRTEGWEVAAYVNNLTDEMAYFSVDRERGRRARISYLTNPPRTYGLILSKQF